MGNSAAAELPPAHRGPRPPYPDDLHIVTQVGGRPDENGGWPHARGTRPRQHAHFKIDRLDVVNLRVGGLETPEPDSIAEQFEALAEASNGAETVAELDAIR